MPTSMPGLWNSIRALMFCLQTALPPPPPAPEGIPLPLVFSTQPFLPLLSSPFLPLPSMAIRWCSGRFSRVFEPHFWSHHKSQNRNALGYPARRHALGYPAHRDALGYPAHRDALGYPAHRSFGLSSPQKCFGLSSPQKCFGLSSPQKCFGLSSSQKCFGISSPQKCFGLSSPQKYISSILYHVPAHTSFFLCTCPPTCSASSPCRPSPHPQSCHFPASSSDLLPTSCCAPGCSSSLARSADLL